MGDWSVTETGNHILRGEDGMYVIVKEGSVRFPRSKSWIGLFRDGSLLEEKTVWSVSEAMEMAEDML